MIRTITNIAISQKSLEYKFRSIFLRYRFFYKMITTFCEFYLLAINSEVSMYNFIFIKASSTLKIEIFNSLAIQIK